MARRTMCDAQGVLGINRVILRYKFGMPVDNAEFRFCYRVSEEDVHRLYKSWCEQETAV